MTAPITRLRQAAVLPSMALALLLLVPALAQARGAPDSFADEAERLLPAVVNISTTQTVEAPAVDMPQFPPGSPFEEFFKQFRGEQGQEQGQGRSRQATALGSGFIIDSSGYIVTNNHVIEGARNITVTLADERTFTAGVVGSDALSDLAVLKVDATDLPVAAIGDSAKLDIGEWVLTIGNALGMGITAKEGIISRLGVSVPVSVGQTLYDLIETSAPINPGNSGGPLVNMAGEVIGITSAKLAAVEVEGLGYAISSNSAGPIIQELVNRGYVVRPWLGVVLGTVNQWLTMRYNLAADTGAIIIDITTESPAYEAGLRPEDVIVSINGKEISTAEELIKVIHAGEVGQEVEITFWRGETKNVTSATLIESPAP